MARAAYPAGDRNQLLVQSIWIDAVTRGMRLKFRDGARFSELEGGSVTLALVTAVDHGIHGQMVRMPMAAKRCWKWTGLSPSREMNCTPLSLMSWRGEPCSAMAVPWPARR